jgi:hypothetical protein
MLEVAVVEAAAVLAEMRVLAAAVRAAHRRLAQQGRLILVAVAVVGHSLGQLCMQAAQAAPASS